jgi:hypothetical protein
VACCCWVAYIYDIAEIDTKGGVNRGPTIVKLGTVTRACCSEKRCCCYLMRFGTMDTTSPRLGRKEQVGLP